MPSKSRSPFWNRVSKQILAAENSVTGAKTPVPQPSPEIAAKPPETPIVIQLNNVGANQQPVLKINQEQIPWDGLEARLKDVYKQREDKVAYVKGDPDVEFEYVAEAVDITHRAGADRIGLMGKKD